MTALAAIADTGSRVSDAAFWWFTALAALSCVAVMFLRAHDRANRKDQP